MGFATWFLGPLALVALALPAPAGAQGGAVQALPGCDANALAREIDDSSDFVPLGFTANFFGRPFTGLFVNDNGNVTFEFPSSAFTPFDFTPAGFAIIAPFWGDVDTRDPGSSPVTYGQTTVDGQPAFCANWVNVGYHDTHSDKLNSFQVLLVSRGPSSGDFDIIFNYDRILWESGDDSGGTGGLGGSSAAVGYSNGDGDPAHFFVQPGSGTPGAFLDSNTSTGLIWGSRGTTQLGRYIFEIRNTIAELGESVVLGVVSGTIRVREPGSNEFRTLEGSETIPLGSSVDATQGHVALASENADGTIQATEYFDGLFRVDQKPNGRVDVNLKTKSKSCKASRRAKGKGSSRVLNRLWGRGGGKTRTRGRGGAGTVRGTFWLTADRCDGTLFKVKEGVVKVRDFKKKRNVVLRAGDKYLARTR